MTEIIMIFISALLFMFIILLGCTCNSCYILRKMFDIYDNPRQTIQDIDGPDSDLPPTTK